MCGGRQSNSDEHVISVGVNVAKQTKVIRSGHMSNGNVHD